MLFSVEEAFVGRDEKRAPLKTAAWEATSTPSRTFPLSPVPRFKTLCSPLIPEKPVQEAATSSYVSKITTIIIWITVYQMMQRTKG